MDWTAKWARHGPGCEMGQCYAAINYKGSEHMPAKGIEQDQVQALSYPTSELCSCASSCYMPLIPCYFMSPHSDSLVLYLKPQITVIAEICRSSRTLAQRHVIIQQTLYYMI